MANVKPIPDGYHSVTPYLIINGATKALDFYKKAFGATELFRMEHEGKIGHAEIKIGDSPVMLADEQPSMGYVGPEKLGNSPVSLMIYVEDVDKVYKQAISSGGTEVKAVQDQQQQLEMLMSNIKAKETEITELKKRLDELTTRITQIKAN